MKIVRSEKRPATALFSQAIAHSILVVEDQQSIAQLLTAMIKDRWQADVHVAHSLQEAREVVAAHPAGFLVATCDLNLPDAPYGEIVDWLNSIGVRTIALTSAYGDELRETILNKGAIDYVRKDNINAYEYVTELVGRLCKNHSLKVLVVDDSMSARAVLKHTLEQLCFKVMTANDGKQGLAVLDANPDISLVLVDYNMPEMDGFTLTVEIRKKFGKDQLAILGISASDDPGISAKFIKSGANDFIHRPYSYEELVCRINQNVEMLELIAANRDAANRDFLTGIFNRRYFFHTGGKIHLDAGKDDQLFLGMIDIDHFKTVNDRHGHHCGDEALKFIAAMLCFCFPDAIVARLGGEEFAVLIDNTTHDDARAQLESFRTAVADTPMIHDGDAIRMSVSIGLTAARGDCIDETLKLADVNLYLAKEQGRNRLIG